MPSPLDLLADYAQRFSASPHATVQDGATSYGPAQTRLTHTPINFTTNTNDMVRPEDIGEYNPNTDRMMVNPIINDPSETVRHESIHAVLNRINAQQEAKIAQSAPNFESIANSIYKIANNNSAFKTSAAQEVPAYMGAAGYSQFKGVSDEQHDVYLRSVRDQLMRINPEAGATFQRLLDAGRRPIVAGRTQAVNNSTGQ
jgi:hypothetical protein